MPSTNFNCLHYIIIYILDYINKLVLKLVKINEDKFY